MRQRNDSGYEVFSHDVGRVIGSTEKFEHPERVTGCTQLYAEDSEPGHATDQGGGDGTPGGDSSDGQASEDGHGDGDQDDAGGGDADSDSKPPKARNRRRAGQDGDAS